MQSRENDAVIVLGKIYGFDRLEDEVALLTAQSQQDRRKRDDVGLWHVFKSKEIRLAFLAGAGLQVKVNLEILLNLLLKMCFNECLKSNILVYRLYRLFNNLLV